MCLVLFLTLLYIRTQMILNYPARAEVTHVNLFSRVAFCRLVGAVTLALVRSHNNGCLLLLMMRPGTLFRAVSRTGSRTNQQRCFCLRRSSKLGTCVSARRCLTPDSGRIAHWSHVNIAHHQIVLWAPRRRVRRACERRVAGLLGYRL